MSKREKLKELARLAGTDTKFTPAEIEFLKVHEYAFSPGIENRVVVMVDPTEAEITTAREIEKKIEKLVIVVFEKSDLKL